MTNVNPFVDGINLKKGCGRECAHLRCTMECEHAQAMSDYRTGTIKRAKSQILSMLNLGQKGEAYFILTEIKKLGIISHSQFECFAKEHFAQYKV